MKAFYSQSANHTITKRHIIQTKSKGTLLDQVAIISQSSGNEIISSIELILASLVNFIAEDLQQFHLDHLASGLR